MGQALGHSMWQADAQGKPLPALLQFSWKDSEPIKAVKKVILAMTSYRPDDRPSMDDVELRLTELNGKSDIGQQLLEI